MAATNRDHSIRLVLAHEGGYTNDLADPGGPTNFGITIYDYRRYVKPGATADDVRAMTVEEAIAIYQAKYWAAMRCDDLTAGVDYAAFDYGVNSGIGRSGKILRATLGLSANTSIIDDIAVRACAVANPIKIINAICDERLAFLQSLKTWPVFGRGWGQRVIDVRAAATAMASGQASAFPTITAQAKAADPDMHARIRALQVALNAANLNAGAVDGDLGPKTIIAFQRSRGLRPDGIDGPQTKPLLDEALAEIAPLMPSA